MDFCSIHQIRGLVGEGNDTLFGRECQRHNHAFGKEDTSKELQNHAAKTQDRWVDAVEKTEVAEIKHAVRRARNRLRTVTIKKFDTKETFQFERIDHEQVAEKQQAASRAKTQKNRWLR